VVVLAPEESNVMRWISRCLEVAIVAAGAWSTACATAQEPIRIAGRWDLQMSARSAILQSGLSYNFWRILTAVYQKDGAKLRVSSFRMTIGYCWTLTGSAKLEALSSLRKRLLLLSGHHYA